MEPNKAHPVSNAIDGTERWWQSPPLSRGLVYNEVNVTLDLGQVRTSFPCVQPDVLPAVNLRVWRMTGLRWQKNVAPECQRGRREFVLWEGKKIQNKLKQWFCLCEGVTHHHSFVYFFSHLLFFGFVLTPMLFPSQASRGVVWLRFQLELHHLSKQQSCAAAGPLPGIRFRPVWLELPSWPVALAGDWPAACKNCTSRSIILCVEREECRLWIRAQRHAKSDLRRAGANRASCAQNNGFD